MHGRAHERCLRRSLPRSMNFVHGCDTHQIIRCDDARIKAPAPVFSSEDSSLWLCTCASVCPRWCARCSSLRCKALVRAKENVFSSVIGLVHVVCLHELNGFKIKLMDARLSRLFSQNCSAAPIINTVVTPVRVPVSIHTTPVPPDVNRGGKSSLI